MFVFVSLSVCDDNPLGITPPWLGNSVLVPGLSAYIVDVTKVSERASALSLGRSAGDLAFLIAPISLGLLADSVSNPAALWTTSLLIAGANAVFFWKTKERYKPPSD